MDINEYENFCKNNHANFMQSSCWAKVKSNWISEYLTVKNSEGKIYGACLVLIRRLPFLNTSMMYVPRGFVCDMHNRAAVKGIFSQLNLLAKKYRAYMLKIDPMIDEDDNEAIEILTDLGFVHHGEKIGYQNIQCRENYVLDIKDKTVDGIFEGFKSKYRYNIRLAARKGVECNFYGKEKLDDFMYLMEQTGERDGFDTRSKEYFERVLNAFDGNAKLCMCYLGSTPLSGALLINYAGTASYVYGCSSNEYRNYMPNYLMQWTMIKQAKETGCSTYDFCGVPYWNDKSHHNYGVYKFKQGFNGYVRTYAGEFDYVYKAPINLLFNLAMSIRKGK